MLYRECKVDDHPLIKEIRQARQKMMAEYDYDIKKIAAMLKESERRHQDRVVSEITIVKESLSR